MDEATARRFEASTKRMARTAAEVSKLMAIMTEVLGMELNNAEALAFNGGVGSYPESAFIDAAEGMRVVGERLKELS